MDDRSRKLAAENFDLARSMAGKFSRRMSEPFDDCFSDASWGLCRAAARFNPAKGCKFSTYAVPTISGEMLRGARDRDPRHRDDRLDDVHIRRSRDHLCQVLGREPNVAEIAESLDWDPSRVERCMVVSERRNAPVYLDSVTYEDGLPISEVIADPDASSAVEMIEFVDSARHLHHRELQAVSLRSQGMSQKRAGEIMGCSQVQVSRLIRSVMRKMEKAAA